MSDETGLALHTSRRVRLSVAPKTGKLARLGCFHGEGGHIAQGLPLPQPEGGGVGSLIVAELLLRDGSTHNCGNLESVDIIVNLSCREVITVNQLGSQTEHKLSRAVCVSLFTKAHSNLCATNISTIHQNNSSDL